MADDGLAAKNKKQQQQPQLLPPSTKKMLITSSGFRCAHDMYFFSGFLSLFLLLLHLVRISRRTLCSSVFILLLYWKPISIHRITNANEREKSKMQNEWEREEREIVWRQDARWKKNGKNKIKTSVFCVRINVSTPTWNKFLLIDWRLDNRRAANVFMRERTNKSSRNVSSASHVLLYYAKRSCGSCVLVRWSVIKVNATKNKNKKQQNYACGIENCHNF